MPAGDFSRVSVIGAGAWGTALAKVLGEKGYPVRLWTRRDEHARAMIADGQNFRYLSGFQLPKSVAPTSSLSVALEGADLVVLVVPSHAFRDTL
ncbi:MAG TPA: 2-dehydropantoate 2-reductase N-terminal domain-containing protein, partial [Polyangiaceae bacterium]